MAENLTKQEKIFCELYVNGQAPYAGNAERCFIESKIGNEDDILVGHHSKELLSRQDIQSYIAELESMCHEEAKDIKRFLTANLKHIIEEASSADFCDRWGNLLSPAGLRGVAVSASKALMEMYPVKEAQVSKIGIDGGDDGNIVFNVIVPEQNKNNK